MTILKKGKIDIISDGQQIVYNDVPGCFKRCGGIGDLLTGSLGLFSYWCDSGSNIIKESYINEPNIIAAYTGSVFIRECSKIAYEKYHRALLAVDIIEEISQTFFNMFDNE